MVIFIVICLSEVSFPVFWRCRQLLKEEHSLCEQVRQRYVIGYYAPISFCLSIARLTDSRRESCECCDRSSIKLSVSSFVIRRKAWRSLSHVVRRSMFDVLCSCMF